jgi:hypothetical protein
VLFTEYAKYLGALARGVAPGLSPRASAEEHAAR